MPSPIIGAPELVEGQSLPETTANEMFRYLEPGARIYTVTDTRNDPPAATEGLRHLVGTVPTGAWVGHANDVAIGMNGGWIYPNMGHGLLCYDRARNGGVGQMLVRNAGGTWEEFLVAGELDDLSDVNAPTPDANDVLTWDDGAGEWIAAPQVGGGVGGTVPNGGTTGQILAKQSGVDQDVDWETIGNYEGGPATPATTAGLGTWVNQGTSTATDGTGALVLKPQVDGLVHGREMVAPSAPFDVYMKADYNCLSSSANTASMIGIPGILLRDSSDGELLLFGAYYERVSGDEQNLYGAILQRWTASGATFSATPVLKYSAQMWPWLRVNMNGAGTTLTLYVSMDGKNWLQVGTETVATFIDAVTRIGVGCLSNSGTTEGQMTVSYFSTTAPA
jgi:hypothetical protein